MRIAVCVKEIPDAGAGRRIDESTKRLVRAGDQVLNPFDGHAIEAALQLVESGATGDGTTITAVCMAPATATRTLQKALALGADDAVLVSGDEFVGSDIVATARALAAALSQGEGYDLVLMGQQAGDSDCWALPGALAELLGRPVLTQASKLELAGTTVTVERQTEVGYEKLEALLPAVVGVSDAINEPRYPSLKAIMGAKKKPTVTLGAGDLGLDASAVGESGSRTSVLALAPPPAREGGIKIEDEGGNSVDQIMEYLSQRSLV
jgi:electron transfer flavoprotein beta subunit